MKKNTAQMYTANLLAAARYKDNNSRHLTGEEVESGLSQIIPSIKKKLFTANHQMVQSFQMPTLVFIIILLIEFLQLNYYSLFDIQVYRNQHYKAEDNHSTGVLFAWNSNQNILKILNYQMLVIDGKAGNNIVIFQTLLFLHLAFFMLLIILTLLLGFKRVMRAEEFEELAQLGKSSSASAKGKQSGSTEDKLDQNLTSKKNQEAIYAILLSIVVFLSQTLLTIPTFLLVSTTYNCEKLSLLSGGDAEDFQCLSQSHILMLAIATVLGVLTLAFLMLESLIFQDLNMKGSLPWRQVPNRLQTLKLLHKVSCLVFNYSVFNSNSIGSIVFLLISFLILIKRYQYTRIYFKTYKRVLLFTELATFWLAFWNFTSQIIKFKVDLYNFTMLIIIGFVPFYLVSLNFYGRSQFEKLAVKEWKSPKEFGSDLKAETYITYIIDLVKDFNRQNSKKLLLFGIIRTHWYSCKKEKTDKCLCNSLMQKISQIEEVIDEELTSRSETFQVAKIQGQIQKIEQEIADQEAERRNNEELMQDQSHYNFDQMMQNINMEVGRDSRREDVEEGSESHFSLPDVSRGPDNWDNQYGYQIDRFKNMSLEQKNFQQQAIQKSIHKIEDASERMNQNHEFRQQFKMQLYRFIYQLVEEATLCYPQSIRLKYIAAFIQYYLLKNEIKGLFEVLLLEKRNKVPLEWQFFFFKVKIEIEDYMDLIHKERSKDSGRIDVKKVYLFAKNLKDFENRMEDISINCVEFWSELIKRNDLNANNLHRVGNQITLMNMEITALVNNMFDINPHHGYLLRIYALFLQKVMNNDEDSEKYFTKFLNAQKTFQSYESPSLKEELLKNFQNNIKYVIIVMRVTTEEIGIVEDVNHEIRTLLGFKRQEVINKNIQMLMPRCVGNLHDQFVQNYLDTAKPKILNKQREVFATKKNGYMQQVFVYVMSVPMLEREGIKFVGFMKKVDEKRYTELLFPPVELQEHPSVQILASPNGNIYGMNEACFRYLGLPKYICDDSDHRLSDSNVSKLIRNHRAVLFECLKNCPTGQEAMISNESFKNVIIPDRHSHNDMNHIRSCFGKYQAIVQAQPMDFGYLGGAYLPLIVYRIYLIDKISDQDWQRAQIQMRSLMSSRAKQMNSPELSGRNAISQSKRVVQSPAFDNLKQYYQSETSYKILQREDTSQYTNSKTAVLLKSQPHKYLANQNEGSRTREDHTNQDFECPQGGYVGLRRTTGKQQKSEPIQGNNNESSIDFQFQKKKFKKELSNKNQNEIEEYLNSSVSSASASNEGRSTDIARLREFRKMVNSKKEPKTVIFLRSGVYLVSLVTLGIMILNIVLALEFYSVWRQIIIDEVKLNDIIIDLFHINVDFRTLINIHNGIQPNRLDNHIPEGQLSLTIQDKLAKTIQELNNKKNMLLFQEYQSSKDVNPQSSKIQLLYLESNGQVVTKEETLNLALSQVVQKGNDLIDISQNNNMAFNNRTFIDYINDVQGHKNYKYGKLGNQIDSVTQHLHFLESNTYSSIINQIEDIHQQFIDNEATYIHTYQVKFLVQMNVILLIVVLSIIVIFPIARRIQKIRVSSLALYAELEKEDVREIISGLGTFLQVIKDESDMLNSIIWQQNENLDGYDDEGENFDELNSQHSVDQDEANQEEEQDSGSLSSSQVKLSSKQSESRQEESLGKSQSCQEDSVCPEEEMSARDMSMSERQLNKKEPSLKNELAEEAQECDEKKVGNLGQFNKVKSNSGFKVFCLIVFMFSFVIIYVLINFAVYIPMFNNIEMINVEKDMIVHQFKNQYRVYSQLVRDLVIGEAQTTLDDHFYDGGQLMADYDVFKKLAFEDQKSLNRIKKHHSETIAPAVSELKKMDTSSYCDVLESHPSLKQENWNKTFCETVDNKVAARQGFYVTLQRTMGQLEQIRLGFESKPANYTRYYELLSKDQTLVMFQQMMQQLFTPSYKVLIYIEQGLMESRLELYRKLDISVLACVIFAQFLVLVIAWPKFLRNMNEQIWKSRGVLTLIPSRLIITNKDIKRIIKNNKLLNQ